MRIGSIYMNCKYDQKAFGDDTKLGVDIIT